MNNTVGWPARAARGVAALSIVALAGCGGSSNTTDTKVANAFPNAGIVIGQPDFTHQLGNQGGTAQAYTLGNSDASAAVDPNTSVLLVPDTSNQRVLLFEPVPTSNNPSAQFVLGQADFTSASPGSGASQLSYPGKVAVAGSGQVVVADTRNNRVLIWDQTPSLNGTPPDHVIGPTLPGATSLSSPHAAMIANGKLFVADTANNRVLIWNDVTTAEGGAAPDSVIGQPWIYDTTSSTWKPDLTHTSINGGLNGPKSISSYPAASDTLYNPQDLWTDGYTLIVADTGNNRVLYYLSDVTQPSSNSYIAASATATGFAAGTYSSIPATGVAGQASFTAVTAGSGESLMDAPNAVASDGTTVAVADTYNNRVLIFGNGFGNNGVSKAPTTVIGQENFNHITANDDDQNNKADKAPTRRTLSNPTGVTFAGDGRLFVTDSGNHRILTFTAPY
jgi:hypothetical protein